MEESFLHITDQNPPKSWFKAIRQKVSHLVMMDDRRNGIVGLIDLEKDVERVIYGSVTSLSLKMGSGVWI